MSVRSSETHSEVEVSQACPADTGSYTVIVQNREGSAQHTVSLSVVGETHMVYSSLEMMQHWYKSLKCMLTLKCPISTTCCTDANVQISDRKYNEEGNVVLKDRNINSMHEHFKLQKA